MTYGCPICGKIDWDCKCNDPSPSTMTTEYRSGTATVWHEDDARISDEGWRELDGRQFQ